MFKSYRSLNYKYKSFYKSTEFFVLFLLGSFSPKVAKLDLHVTVVANILHF